MKIKSYKQRDYINIEVRTGEKEPKKLLTYKGEDYLWIGSRSWVDKVILQYSKVA